MRIYTNSFIAYIDEEDYTPDEDIETVKMIKAIRFYWCCTWCMEQGCLDEMPEPEDIVRCKNCGKDHKVE